MKIAYLLLVHEYERNVKYLITQLLKDEDCDIYIHVDKTICKELFYYENSRVYFITKRYSVKWGGFSMVKATLSLIETAKKNGKYNYYCLLSGRDFLIKPILEFKKILSAHYPKSLIDGGTITERWTSRGLDRVKFHFFYIFKNRTLALKQNRIVRKIGHFLKLERKMPMNYIPYCGSQWWTISDKHINYILDFLLRNRKFYRFYKTVGIPDEQIFQTILFNSHMKNELINYSQTFVCRENGLVRELALSDLDMLLKLENSFFARKVKYDDLKLAKTILKYN